MALVEAAGEVPITWNENDYQPAILYLTAHLLVLAGVLAGGGGGASVEQGEITVGGITYQTAGGLASVKVGDVDVKFGGGGSGGGSSSSGQTGGGYVKTTYGQRFLEIRSRNMPFTGQLVRG